MKKWLAVLLCVLLAGCLAACSQGEPAEEGPSSSQAEEGDVTYVYSYEPVRTLEELMEESTLVVRGTAVGADLLTIDGVEGGTTLTTEYQVEVSQVLRGDLELPATLPVQRHGNAEATSGTFFVGEAVLEEGQEYLLFLEDRSGVGGSYNLAGERYAVVGGEQGVFQALPATKGGEASFRSQGKLEVGQQAAQVTEPLAQLESRLEEVNQETPPNPDQFREEAFSGIEKNRESGFITQEEYDAYKAQLEEFATLQKREALW